MNVCWNVSQGEGGGRGRGGQHGESNRPGSFFEREVASQNLIDALIFTMLAECVIPGYVK